MLQPTAIGKNLQFEMRVAGSVPDCLHGDATHLRQILVNLLSNAIKFTEHGKVTLDVSSLALSTSAARLRFGVRDTGIGIPEEARQRIFGAFEQVNSGRSRRYGGSGLGMTIAKTLTEMMGGEIAFESKEGIGSDFWVDLPFAVAAMPEQAGEMSSLAAVNIIDFDDPFVRHRARVRKMRLLIADDQPANLLVLRRLLEKAGHDVQLVNNGEQMLESFENESFDAAIIDLHMPEISGIDVIKQARVMQAGYARTPFIVLSADATAEAMRATELAGASKFLTKPVAATPLLEALAEIANADALQLGAMSSRVDNVVTVRSALEELYNLHYSLDFIKLFVSECVRDALKCVSDLDLYGESANWDKFRETCHALKGVVLNVGAIKLADSASDAMKQPNWQLTREWRHRVQLIREQFEAARIAVCDACEIIAARHDKGGSI